LSRLSARLTPGFVEVKPETPRKCLAVFAAVLDYYRLFLIRGDALEVFVPFFEGF
jgi:hypothetical protein